jgi:hypothetical protein
MAYDKMREGLRDGSVSMKAMGRIPGVAHFSNKTLRETRLQPTKMTEFENKHKTDEYEPEDGIIDREQMNMHRFQKTSRADESGHPTKDRGAVKSEFAKSRGSKFSKGSGGVIGSQEPGSDHIDQYPRGVGKTFPKGAKYAGPPSKKTGNTKMLGKQPLKSGGPEGHNAKTPRYYGGPNDRKREGTY